MLYTAHSKRALPKRCKDSFSLWYGKYVKLEPPAVFKQLQRQAGPEGLANHKIISLFALNISKLQPVLPWQLRGGNKGQEEIAKLKNRRRIQHAGEGEPARAEATG